MISHADGEGVLQRRDGTGVAVLPARYQRERRSVSLAGDCGDRLDPVTDDSRLRCVQAPAQRAAGREIGYEAVVGAAILDVAPRDSRFPPARRTMHKQFAPKLWAKAMLVIADAGQACILAWSNRRRKRQHEQGGQSKYARLRQACRVV